MTKNIICHSWGGRVRAVFEKWAFANRPKMSRFQKFYHFEFKI
jgi:hypothetical protein